MIQLANANDGHKLWRFQVGNFELSTGGRIQIGFPGMSDLMGPTTVTVTPEMVGQKLAIFTACEVKTENARTEKERLKSQRNFIAAVNRAGGRAGFAHSVEMARDIWRGRECDLIGH